MREDEKYNSGCFQGVSVKKTHGHYFLLHYTPLPSPAPTLQWDPPLAFWPAILILFLRGTVWFDLTLFFSLSVHFTLAKLSQLFKPLVHNGKEVPAESRAQRPVKDMPLCSAASELTQRQRNPVSDISAQAGQSWIYSQTHRVERTTGPKPVPLANSPSCSCQPTHICDSTELGAHSCLVWVTSTGFFFFFSLISSVHISPPLLSCIRRSTRLWAESFVFLIRSDM